MAGQGPVDSREKDTEACFYDDLGQVTSGKRYWSDGTAVAGQQFEHASDDIGNRQSAASGGDATGSGLCSEAYSVNAVNQYTQRTVPGAVVVMGEASESALVLVNGQTACEDCCRAEGY